MPIEYASASLQTLDEPSIDFARPNPVPESTGISEVRT
jgi:hypothetical protein